MSSSETPSAIRAKSENPGLIGRPEEDVLAVAFAGGGFETALQLGMIHALLVSDGRPPDVVAGISAGAVNAAALAEILQAGAGLPGEERSAARVARFREVLDIFQQSPSLLYNSFLPDPYEVNAQRPLKPIDLPIHHKQERELREDFSRERSGLIALINDLLAIRIPVRVVTQAVRRILGLIAVREERNWLERWSTRVRHGIGLWRMWLRYLFLIAPLVGVFLSALWHMVSRQLPQPGIDFLGRFPALRNWMQSGNTAGSIILNPRLRSFKGAVFYCISLLAAFVLWLMPLFLGVPLVFLLLREASRRVPVHSLQALNHAFFAGRSMLTALWLLAVGTAVLLWLVRLRLPEMLLRRYHLLDSLVSPHPLREMFVKVFDPGYYGPIHLSSVLTAALKDERSAGDDRRHYPKKLRRFAEAGIHVAPVAADIETGRLTVLHQETPIVDALLAAVASTPLFAAQELEKERGGKAFYIDGINIANEPTSVIMDLLREKIHPLARRAKVFAVSSLPVSHSGLAHSGREYQGLIPVLQRVFALKRFRDAYLERKLTKLHTRVADLYVRKMNASDTALQEVAGQRILRADIYGIEPDEPLSLNLRLAQESDAGGRRKLIREAVADGCRSALEKMIQPSISSDAPSGVRSCRHAIRAHLAATPSLPGSGGEAFGPGVAEVCQACALNRSEKGARISLRSLESSGFSWPRRQKQPEAGQASCREVSPPAGQRTEPAQRAPQISILFSGGVFRGVFQMGSITALSEVEAKPQIFAGASVGSITAAMAARLFASPDQKERTRRIALLASTYLSLDRLVLTDRFADFVRRFTIRAGAADLSVAETDRFFRRYDQGTTQNLGKTARKVVAGLERLFYLTPFELLNLLRALRLGKASEAFQQLSFLFQDFLDRFDVGQEILGSEPLAFLIAHHVLSDPLNPAESFASFTGDRATLIAVTTNLTKGLLEILPGFDVSGVSPSPAKRAVLLQALLASSAFPAVFRPRWSWEVFPRSAEVCQYVDGGVMDNLPLDAVVQYLHGEAEKGKVSLRPISRASGEPVPHLLFAASLEPRLYAPKDPGKVAGNWLALRTRSQQLGYNRKSDGFRAAQQRFRAVYESIVPKPGPGDWQPLDIEVVTVKPEWLCSTFGFHPMLGFRRKKQEQNIAHGCAMTLGTLYAVERKSGSWVKEWGFRSLVEASEHAVEKGAVQILNSDDLTVRLFPQRRRSGGKSRNEGECWFRCGAVCPFSKTRTKLDSEIPKVLGEELHKIYELCGQERTHRPPAATGHLYEVG